jgi:nitroreductase
MTKQVLSALFSAARQILRDWRALAALAALYAALVAACWLFVTTREARVWQIALTALLAAAIPLLLFVLIAACGSYAVGESRAMGVVSRGLRGFWKVALVAVPFIALVVGTVYGMNKLENRVKHDPQEEASVRYAEAESGRDETDETADAAVRPKPKVRWAYVAVSALRLLLLGFVLPLAAVHLWLAALGEGFGAMIRGLFRTLARAYSARSVFTYAVGMLVFALLPYFLIVKRTPASSGWLELTLFGLRVGLAFLLTLFGWLATTRALARPGDGSTGARALAPQPIVPPATPTVTAAG